VSGRPGGPAPAAKFTTTLARHGKTAAGIEVPDAVVERLGTSRRPAVRVTINSYTYPSTVGRMGGRYLVPVSAAVRAAANVAAGDNIDVVLVLDLTRSAGGRAR